MDGQSGTALGERLVFFSHSGVDTAEAQKVVARIREAPSAIAQRVRVWFDKDDLRAGERWQPQIEEAIRCSTAFVVYVGSGGIANWVDAEVRVALNRAMVERGYVFLPILSADAPKPETLPGFVQQFQAIKADGSSAEWFERVVGALLGEGKHELEKNPFFGLRAIDETHSHLFFGREEETKELVKRLHREPLVLVVGDSGSGKSSLVRAGLVPQFRGGALAALDGERPQDEVWHVLVMRPGGDPRRQLSDAIYDATNGLGVSARDRDEFAEWAKTGDEMHVARALRRGSPLEKARVLLVVDQFEELWTSTPKDARGPFVDLLLELVNGPGRVRVVLTMRRDYANLCSEFPRLHERLEANERRARYDLSRPGIESLERIVTEPLRLAGVEKNARESLARVVRRHVGERPGDLALVQMALTEAWNARQAHAGDLLQAYNDVGGVEGALALAAERTREARGAQDGERIDSILIRLVQLGDTGGATPRDSSRHEFDDERWMLVQFLADEGGKRLVLIAGSEHSPTAEIAHEALVGAWPHLQTTLQSCAADKRIFDDLIPKASAWLRAKPEQKSGQLAVGAELDGFVRLLDARAAWLSPSEKSFVKESRSAIDQRLRREKATLLAIQLLAAVAVIFGSAAGWFGYSSRVAARRAEDARNAANAARDAEKQAGELAKRNAGLILAETGRQLLDQHPARAAVFLSEAYRTAQTVGTKASLGIAMHPIDEWIATLEGHTNFVIAASFSPSGERVVTGSGDNTAKLWDAKSGKLLATLEGHRSTVRHLSFSPDGERIVTGSLDNTAKLWDGKSGKWIATLEGHTEPVFAAAFSSDSQRVVTASDDTTAKVWDGKSGKLLITLVGHSGSLPTASFSPDGKRIVTASLDQTAKLWDASSGRLLGTLKGHTAGVHVASFSPDSARIVTGSDDDTAKLWDGQTGKLVKSLTGHTESVVDVGFSFDGERVITASRDKTAKLWDGQSGELLATLEGHTHVLNTASFSPDGERAITASRDKTAKLWDGKTGKLLATLDGHSGSVNAALFSPDGERIVTGSEDNTARLWEGKGGKLLATLADHTADVRDASFSPDGGRVVTVAGGAAKLWERKGGQLLATLEGNTASFSPDGERVVTAAKDNTAKVWDGKSGKQLATLAGHAGAVYAASFSPTAGRIVTSSEDKTAKVWDGKSGELLATLNGMAAAASFSADGERIVFTDTVDKAAKVWNATNGKLLATLGSFRTWVNVASFSPDGQRVLTVHNDDTAKLWDWKSGMLLATLAGHTGRVNAASFSPDSERIVTASLDYTAKLWDGTTGKLLATLEGHTYPVEAASFSPDSQRVVTASWDKTAKLWDVKSGELLTTLEGHTEDVRVAKFSPDGQSVVTASDDRTAKLWDVHLETRSPEVIADIVAKRVPWKLQDGVLVPR